MTGRRVYRLSRYGLHLLKTRAVISSYSQQSYQQVSLLLDTGSSFTILPYPVLEHLGYNLEEPLRQQTIIL